MNAPDVGVLLAIDREYREKSEVGLLRKIAPRHYNPEHVAWLPVLHSHAAGWDFTALFSNTAQAHELHRTHDWVLIFFESDEGRGQATVVTERRGSLAGLRVVRGREPECARHYRALAAPAAEHRTSH